MSLPGGHLESLGGGWLGLLLGACLAGELGVAGAPGEWDAWMFFSSEKSCLITSKKLLNGLPTQMGRKEKTKRERENKQQMSNEVNVRRRRGGGGGDGGMRGGVEAEERRLVSRGGGRRGNGFRVVEAGGGVGTKRSQ